MKIISVVFVLTSGLFFSQTAKTIPTDYRKIPEILDTVDYLYPFVKPDKKYAYWKVLRNINDPEKAIIYESQMPDYMTINEPPPSQGFFQEYVTENCFSYVIACKSERAEYFTNEQQLRDFIGSVDNISEALLVAKTYGYTFDSKNKLGGSYKMENDYFLLYLSKSKDCPAPKESFFIRINKKTGKLEAKSNGLYKNDHCTQ